MTTPQTQAKRILIANRGEIACRLIRTYKLFPLFPDTPRIETVAIFTPSESAALHASLANFSHQLSAEGPRAYLDRQALIDIAISHSCWGIAPGYGFLSEDSSFAKLCEDNRLVFLGPTSTQLSRLGDKVIARELARQIGVPILEGTRSGSHSTLSDSSAALDDILAFASTIPRGQKLILKAANGGGGRGIRVLPFEQSPAIMTKLITEAYHSCTREAQSAFGDGTVYAERFLTNAKHVEVQILGDGRGNVCHFWDRECSLQRRNQKLIEIAPAVGIDEGLRKRMIQAALRLGREVKLRSLTTIEFLVEEKRNGREREFYFLEANPRIQVEHTVTEQICNVDLVALQALIGLGYSLAELGITGADAAPFPTNTSIQARINAESFRGKSDETSPESGSVSSLSWPSGGHLRIETAAHAPRQDLGEYKVSPLFDSLLAKVIVTAPSYASAVDASKKALIATEIKGVKTNISFLRALLSSDMVKRGAQHIHTVQTGFKGFLEQADYFETTEAQHSDGRLPTKQAANGEIIDEVGSQGGQGKTVVKSHLSGLVVKLSVKEGEGVVAGQELVVVEAMKMEHVIRAPSSGVVSSIIAKQGGVVNNAETLLVLDSPESSFGTTASDSTTSHANTITEDPSKLRPELQELNERRHAYSDDGRKDAKAKRHARGYRTVRENLSMLIDANSLVEYGDLTLAAQKKLLKRKELIAKTTGDGILTAYATISNHPIALVLGDYMVLAGTQGYFHHLKLDRILHTILAHPVPLVLYAEGGGGRPSDTDYPSGSGLVTPSFALMGRVRASGMPVVGVGSGYVFAGNAALLGMCDIVIATRGGNSKLGGGNEKGGVGKTSIGMGGKAMIEAGGLGKVESDDIGPVHVHEATGAIDVTVEDEDEAAATARKLMGYLTDAKVADSQWTYSANPLLLRTALPQTTERRRAFDMRQIINLFVDDESFVEFSPLWGQSIITGFARISGSAIAILASNPQSPLGGALDIPSAHKVIRLLRLLSRTRAMHVLSLCDTPGFMVGPKLEASADSGGSFRVFGDWFTASCEYNLSGGKIIGLVIRRAFGLGAQAMLGGSTLNNSICASWPGGCLGPMSLEGAVQIRLKKQLDGIQDEEQKKEMTEKAVEQLYANASAINVASMAEIDTVIEPAETREWLCHVIKDVLGERKAAYKVRRDMVANPHL
ncbi:related to PYC2 - pyruvate carboxylase 2 [Melanopsichium pennsylvanicum]|uniref:Related to PYC2 - pyruvate carboxylase 2 n=2 Tax=Melanopsichium pennsylvanicum TaxID=63383 RepID=A0AAJ5C8D4_9BASI|nr:related to PYC2-pyruvate carboxylase 2 [Melanopsichium pennsylvanicum 4]SNX87871.1 related to PYC2 - pyruvate carboxylase 2 [Melanopsichium pennsylvanicum]